MLLRRQMTDEEDIVRPREVDRVLRATDDEAAVRPGPRWLQQQPPQSLLSVGGIGAEIGKCRLIMRRRLGTPIQGRIGPAIERGHPPRAQPRTHRIESAAAGVAQHEVERCQTVRAEIGDRLACGQAVERHRRIEIVEAAKHVDIADEVGRAERVGAERGHHRDVRLADRTASPFQDLRPTGIEDQRAAIGEHGQVSIVSVVTNVALEERDPVAARRQRPDQPAPQRGVTVSP